MSSGPSRTVPFTSTQACASKRSLSFLAPMRISAGIRRLRRSHQRTRYFSRQFTRNGKRLDVEDSSRASKCAQETCSLAGERKFSIREGVVHSRNDFHLWNPARRSPAAVAICPAADSRTAPFSKPLKRQKLRHESR